MPRCLVVILLDALTIALAATALGVTVAGGFALRFSQIRISFRTPGQSKALHLLREGRWNGERVELYELALD